MFHRNELTARLYRIIRLLWTSSNTLSIYSRTTFYQLANNCIGKRKKRSIFFYPRLEFFKIISQTAFLCRSSIIIIKMNHDEICGMWKFFKKFFQDIYIYIALCYIRSIFLYIHLLLQLMKIILREKISRRYKIQYFLFEISKTNSKNYKNIHKNKF